jgi:hypothetical protein
MEERPPKKKGESLSRKKSATVSDLFAVERQPFEHSRRSTARRALFACGLIGILVSSSYLSYRLLVLIRDRRVAATRSSPIPPDARAPVIAVQAPVKGAAPKAPVARNHSPQMTDRAPGPVASSSTDGSEMERVMLDGITPGDLLLKYDPLLDAPDPVPDKKSFKMDRGSAPVGPTKRWDKIKDVQVAATSSLPIDANNDALAAAAAKKTELVGQPEVDTVLQPNGAPLIIVAPGTGDRNDATALRNRGLKL